MKYTNELIINRPVSTVVAAFMDPQRQWMEGLEHAKLLEGSFGAVGAKSQLQFKLNGRNMEMVETVTANDLPNSVTIKYDSNNVENWEHSRFEAVGENQTRYVSESTFKFGGFMRLVALVAKGSFVKQSQKNMATFKAYVENQA